MTLTRIYARKCQLKEFKTRSEVAQAKEFIRTNHGQGLSRGSKVFYGLLYDNEIVMVMTFGNPRFNRNFEYEIIRECSKKNTLIVGGSSRLWKAFRTDYKPTAVIVYTSMKEEHAHAYSDHYTKHLGFKRLATSKMKWNGRYVSNSWPRDDSYGREYAESSIIHYGPDRMLGTKLAYDNGSNHEIMLNLGYTLKRTKEPSPVVDYWTVLESQEPVLSGRHMIKQKLCECGKFVLLLDNEDTEKWQQHITSCRKHEAGESRIVYASDSLEDTQGLITRLKKIVSSSKVGSRRLLNK